MIVHVYEVPCNTEVFIAKYYVRKKP